MSSSQVFSVDSISAHLAWVHAINNDLLSAQEQAVQARNRTGGKALRTPDKFIVLTPVNWQPGDKVVAPPPKTAAGMEKRPPEGYEGRTGIPL